MWEKHQIGAKKSEWWSQSGLLREHLSSHASQGSSENFLLGYHGWENAKGGESGQVFDIIFFYLKKKSVSLSPVLLRDNWFTSLNKFKEYGIMIYFIYIWWNQLPHIYAIKIRQTKKEKKIFPLMIILKIDFL